jgi:predicted PurR-regulated permease PerM
VDAVQRTRLPRPWAIAVVYVAAALAVAGIGGLVAPNVGSQVSGLTRTAQRTVVDLRNNATFRRYDNRYHVTQKARAQLKALPSRLTDETGPLRDITIGALGFVSDLVAVLSIAFLVLLHGDRYARAAISALPSPQARRWQRLAPQIYRAVSGYVLGNLAISAIAGTGAWIALTALGVPFALPLALVMAFLDLIPMVGATLGAIIIALAALVVSPAAALLWLLYSVVYQQIENYVIQPLVYRRSVQVSPLSTIIAVLVGGTLLGLLGALLAIPAAAIVQLVAADVRGVPAGVGAPVVEPLTGSARGQT